MSSPLIRLPGLAAAGVVSFAVLVAAVAAIITLVMALALAVLAAFGVVISYGIGLIT